MLSYNKRTDTEVTMSFSNCRVCFISPCELANRDSDEVLILSNGMAVIYFESGGKRDAVAVDQRYIYIKGGSKKDGNDE